MTMLNRNQGQTTDHKRPEPAREPIYRSGLRRWWPILLMLVAAALAVWGIMEIFGEYDDYDEDPAGGGAQDYLADDEGARERLR